MGKNWRGGRGGRGGGRGGRGGFGGQNTIGSCRGHGIIMGTCDTAREREANKEIINLIDLLIEEMEESGQIPKKEVASKEGEGGDKGPASNSIEAMMAAEIQQVQNHAHSGTQNAMAVNTGTKGLYIIKLKRRDVDPVVLVRAMFAKIGKEKKSYTRHVCRVLPLTDCFFPNEEQLVINFRKALKDVLPDLILPPQYINFYEGEEVKLEVEGTTVTEMETTGCDGGNEGIVDEKKEESKKRDREESEQQTDKDHDKDATVEAEDPSKKAKTEGGADNPSSATAIVTESKEEDGDGDERMIDASQEQDHPPFSYQILFKRRNHDSLTKSGTMEFITNNMPSPPLAIPTYKNADYVFLVEAMQNICGVALFTSKEYQEMKELNLRKFTQQFDEVKEGVP